MDEYQGASEFVSNSSDAVISFMANSSVLDEPNSEEGWKKDVKPVLDILLLLVLLLIMLAMGCEITWKELYAHARRPIGLCIGLLSQFVVMPLSAFCVLLATGISDLRATGVLIISCCPGGVLSNTFTYFCDGDLSLSVAMTSVSTVIAIGMMPVNLWLYGGYFESESEGLVIPYEKMAMSLVSVTSPVAVGMLLKWKLPRVAAVISKIGSYSGILLFVMCIFIEVVVFPNMFDVSAKLYAVVLSLPLVGLGLGYGLAAALRRDQSVRKTVSIECGVQNVPVALTIIALSFPFEVQKDLVLLPWLWGLGMTSWCSILCIIYNLNKKSKSVELERPESDRKDSEKKDTHIKETITSKENIF